MEAVTVATTGADIHCMDILFTSKPGLAFPNFKQIRNEHSQHAETYDDNGDCSDITGALSFYDLQLHVEYGMSICCTNKA